MSFVKDTFFGGAEKKAAQAQERAIGQGIDRIDATGRQIRADLDPTIQRGEQASELYGDFIGLGGPEAERAALNDYIESPGQAFLRERGRREVLASAAATGGLRGGNVMKELTEFGIGTAATDLDNRLNRLRGVADSGDYANLSRAGMSADDAYNVANLNVAEGNARASGITARSGAIRNSLAKIAGAFTGTGGFGSAPGANGLPQTVGGAGAVNPYDSGVPAWFRRGGK